MNVIKTLIGNQYPFFLNNNSLSEYYLYQINTPGLSPAVIPYISMTKISEKTGSGFPWGNDSDVISVAMGSKKSVTPDNAVKFIEGIIKESSPTIKKNEKKFPLIELTGDINMQKALILGLRQSVKKKLYKFTPGNFVDILWTSKEFAIFKICGNEKEIWIEPQSVYRNTDVNFENPITIDWNKFDRPTEKFTNIQDFCRFIKKLEWSSFDRRQYKIDYRK